MDISVFPFGDRINVIGYYARVRTERLCSMQELISIIIPVYNAEKTLRRAVDSALAEQGTEKEIILVDDGSADASVNLEKEYARQYDGVRLVELGQTVGVSAARNAGLRAAEGAFVTFLDADDALDPDMLARLLALHHETGAEICGCTFRSVRQEEALQQETPEHSGMEAGAEDSAEEAEPHSNPEDRSGAGVSQETGRPRRKTSVPIHVYTGQEVITDAFLQQHDTRVWSKLFTREVVAGHWFEEDLTIGEDSLFVLSLLKPDTRYAVTEEALYRYTVNPAGAMERPFTPAYMDQLGCWEKVRQLIEERFPDLLAVEENEARLSALQIVSAVLAASKIQRLPKDRREAYGCYFDQCRESAVSYGRSRAARQLLPGDYRVKLFLLRFFPKLYGMIYQTKWQK